MSLARSAVLFRTWIILIAVTALSFWTAEYLSNRRFAVAVLVVIAATKVELIMLRFMDIRTAPRGIRTYLTAWNLACAVLIYGMWFYAR